MAIPFRTQGAWTALVTPFDKSGRLDEEAFRRLVEFQVEEGIHGLVPAGTTGESPTLTWEEHNHVIESAVRIAKDRVGVLAGTGSNCTGEAVTATRHAREAGAHAALLVDCYYNTPSSLELRTEYYERVLDLVPELPIVPYVLPGRTSTALSVEDLAILHADHAGRVPAVKEATGDLERMRHTRQTAGPSLAIFSGDDDLTLPMMQDPRIGAAGVISVMSNLVPGAVAHMVSAQRQGDASKASELGRILAPLFKLVSVKASHPRKLPGGGTAAVEDRFRNPVPVKAMMVGLGMPAGPCRRPLGKMTPAGVAKCREALREVWRAGPELLAPIGKAFGVNLERRLQDDAAWAEVTRV